MKRLPHRKLSTRTKQAVKSTAVRATLLASLFGCTATAIAGGHGSAVNTGDSSTGTTSRLKTWFQTGQASWYGLKFQGRRTATGEKFDMNTFTCAHRSLPLGSWLRVTNLRNRKAVLVRVNDRGPMTGNRIIDLSYAAANAVGIGGLSQVKLERVSPSDPEVARVLLAQFHMPTLPRIAPAL